MADTPKVSIIIRSKDEEKWIGSCLDVISRQAFADYEIILVDNCSTDKTVDKALQYGVKALSFCSDEYYPGRAINQGIQASTGELVAIISAHCIPVNEDWLGNLVRNFDDPGVAGVYGRQEPLPFTSDLDKRDLINLFGLDRKVQRKDPFFHNANSMIRRAVWERIPFDDDTLHIEDRIWAQQVLAEDMVLVYDPDASVYHYHGINQGRNIGRAQRIVRILERIHQNGNAARVHGTKVAAIIPSRGKQKMFLGTPLIERAIASAKDNDLISRIYVASDNPETLATAERCGAYPIERPMELSAEYVGLDKVYQFALERIEAGGFLPDCVATLEEIYPFRPEGLLNEMIRTVMLGSHDSVIAARPDYGTIWKNTDTGLARVDERLPSSLKDPFYRGLMGLGCVVLPGVIRSGDKLGQNVGLIPVTDEFSRIVLRSSLDLAIAEGINQRWETAKESRKDNQG